MTHLQKAFQLDPLLGPNCSTWANSCPSAAVRRTAALRSSSQAQKLLCYAVNWASQKSDTGKMTGYLLTGSVLMGLYQPGEGRRRQRLADESGPDSFSLPAAAARANTDCNGCWITGSVFGNTVLGRFKHLLLAVPEVHQHQCAD